MNQPWQYFVICCLAFLCYSVTINGNFVFDDTEAIVKNKDILPTTSLINMFRNDFWGNDIKLNASHKSYRPLTVLTFRLDYFLGSGLNSVQFHVTNTLLYCILCCLSLPLYQVILEKNLDAHYAFLSSILFTLHPLHTETVAGLVGRADILSAILFVFGLLLYSKALKQKFLLYFSLSIIAIGTAVFCKETAITGFGVCGVFDFLTKKPLKNRKSLKLYCYRIGCLIGFLIIIMYYRLKVMNFERPIFAIGDNPTAFSSNTWTKILTFNYIYFLNFILLLWPHWLCFDWSMGCIPLIEKYCDGRIILVITFWIFIIYSCYKLFYKVYSEKLKNIKHILMGVCLLILPFLPASNIFFKVGFVIAERILLLPSLGHCLLIIIGFYKIQNHFKSIRKQILIYLWFLYILFAIRTFQRNTEWLNEEKLFTSALNVCPLNAKVHYNVGKIFADKNNSKLAKEKYRKAIELNPFYEQAMNNLANLLREENEFLEAASLLKKAVEIRPNFAAAWMNLGIVLSNLNETVEAENCYLTAIRHRKRYPDCYYNLGNLYLDLNRYEEALKSWEMAVSFKPTHKAAWSNMLVLLNTLERFDEAIKYSTIALIHNPNVASLYFNTANTLGKLKKFNEAKAHFLKAIELDPNNALYYSNLGVLYHQWNRLLDAEKMYKKALELNSKMEGTAVNLKKLRMKMNILNEN
ncbi:transmembrane and TPR repeat-containing protein 4 isoform X1 [Agrilus planipennis]|uniref:dolichyl-phosphate-mannose--protein mannosyltransferase n=1 Tax=Agrilus planipennis TaxID=224129 RepID=A0A1W4X688_AGRPL|nr:transmembrane and TPR repeat-containing protein 4 isoform X1 [Agrilus planipennis]